MPRETIQEKSLRYIAEGRLRVLEVNPDARTATIECKGSRERPYTQRFYQGVWACNCEARVECAHLTAAKLVVPWDATVDPSFADSASDPELDAFLADI
jgi:hypothetical protein